MLTEFFTLQYLNTGMSENHYLQFPASVDYSFYTIYLRSDRCIEISTDLIVDGLRLEWISIYCHSNMFSAPHILICTGLQKWDSHFQGCEQRHVFVNAHQSKSVKKVSLSRLLHLLYMEFMISQKLDY